jgi:hypothetical protein
MMSELPDTSPDEMARLREFVDRWKIAGPELQRIRLAKLESLSDEEARRMVLDLLSHWKPSTRDRQGEELVAQQRVFAKLVALERAKRDDLS